MKKFEEKNLVSNKTLLLSMLIALILSFLIYLIVILPAEFNQDPTGLGKKLGLTILSPTESTPTNDTEIVAYAKNALKSSAFTLREDEQTISIPANTGIEYKVNVKQFDTLKYEWKTTDNSHLYFDFHGEPEGDTTGYFESYSIATANQMKGTATVPFHGSHGWYWKNNHDTEVTIHLKTTGHYEIIDLKQ
ncbi:FIG01061391: hypothetical protein [hydrothermal vent metagenome]|uniref:Transmembrane anchor protein n=1 Tax=hydrothermal vent metagenome TaxID=652676 RepID=A0A3B0W3F8_9ZZZZ